MASEPSPTSQLSTPIPVSRMIEIATEACDSALETATCYDHPQTATWNTNIINKTLASLILASSTPSSPPFHKYAVTSTIIQHASPARSKTEGTDFEGKFLPPPPIGRAGMHSATGAYWDNAKDGCWSFKYHKAEGKGFDVIISVIWVSVL